jgi:AraC family transcriptional regulator
MNPRGVTSTVPRLGPGQFFGRVIAETDAGGVSVREMADRPVGGVPRHSHEHAHFCLVIAGRYETDTRNLRGSCDRLTLLYHPAGTTHEDHFCALVGRTLMVSLEPGTLESFGGPALLGHSLALAEEELGFPACRIRRELHAADRLSPLSIDGLVLDMVERVLRRTEPTERAAPVWLRDAREFLRESASERTRVADIARAVGVHPVHLARVFRTHVGVSPGEYLRRSRVRTAMGLIESTTEPLATVAYRAGFCDQSDMTKSFGRELGTTPAGYRRAFAG